MRAGIQQRTSSSRPSRAALVVANSSSTPKSSEPGSAASSSSRACCGIVRFVQRPKNRLQTNLCLRSLRSLCTYESSIRQKRTAVSHLQDFSAGLLVPLHHGEERADSEARAKRKGVLSHIARHLGRLSSRRYYHLQCGKAVEMRLPSCRDYQSGLSRTSVTSCSCRPRVSVSNASSKSSLSVDSLIRATARLSPSP